MLRPVPDTSVCVVDGTHLASGALAGINPVAREDFAGIVRDSRRELWLWLAGERTWDQACAGLLGRIERRTPAGLLASWPR